MSSPRPCPCCGAPGGSAPEGLCAHCAAGMAHGRTVGERPSGGAAWVVCPRCGYAFAGPAGGRAVCPDPACGYVWEHIAGTLADVASAPGREAFPELRLAGGQRIPLPPGESWIGRDEGCLVRLSNLHVSRRHVKILRSGADCRLLPAADAGPVLRNGAPPGSAPLAPGDRLVVGGETLEFRLRFAGAGEAGPPAAGPLLPALFRGASAGPVPLTDERLSIGRGEDRDLRLLHPLVSRRHAYLLREGAAWIVADTRSSGGTFVNGRSVLRAELARGDRLRIGPYEWSFELDRLDPVTGASGADLEAEALSQTAGGRRILDRVSLRIRPRQFVGLLGASGAGKSTLLDALNGLRPACEGRVRVNGEDFYARYDAWRDALGYVPQEDALHRELPVRRALGYAARLRLPGDTGAEEIARIVDEAIRAVGLEDRAEVTIASLSGGQRKRVAIAAELLSQPRLLFLDEPTSGLDPGTEARMMQLFRRLADQGRTVVCTTHILDNADLFDTIAVLHEGRLVYAGPPAEAPAWFGVPRLTGLYDRLREEAPQAWAERFETSALRPATLPAPAVVRPPAAVGRQPRRGPLLQFPTLALRFLDLLCRDRGRLALLALQPAFLTFLTCLVCDNLPMILYLTGISALWSGCNNAITQIVRERTVYRRERMVSLRIADYLLGKVLPLGAISVLQCALQLGLVCLFDRNDGSLPLQYAIMLLTAWAGMGMGLAVSTLCRNADRAEALVPMMLLPALIFAGMTVPPREMNTASKLVSYATVMRWTHQALSAETLRGRVVPSPGPEAAAFVREWRSSLAMIDTETDFVSAAETARFLSRWQDRPLPTLAPYLASLWILLAFGGALLAVAYAVLAAEG